MAGVATTCKDNPATGRQGCGAGYGGRMLHCVAPADWSTHDDGLCHETFGAETGCNFHVGVDRHGDLWHLDPHTLPKLRRDERGIWRQPPPDLETAERLRAVRATSLGNAESGPAGVPVVQS